MRLSNRLSLALVAAGTALVTVGGTTAWAAPGGSTGPSSSDAPYLVRATPGVTFTSVLTTGDSVGGYAMAGIPDGLGAFDNGDGTFTLLMNHEIGATAGVVRAHGAKGAFVSKWVVDKETLQVVKGEDQIKKVFLWNATTSSYVETAGVAFSRFCSADLPAASAFYNAATGKGYDGRIYTNGEETGLAGRAFGHVVETGETYQLPAFGGASWENIAANPATGDKTVVVGQSDAGGGRVVVYVGDKKTTGNPVEKAGLTGGTRYAIAVDGVTAEDGAVAYPSGDKRFSLVVDTPNNTKGTGFDRPEDGSWDPSNPNDYYFVTTASMTKQSRLWRLRFDDVNDPAKGGTITKLVEGPAGQASGPKMMDNLTVNDRGQVIIQEDTGNNAYLAGVYQYDIASGEIRRIADHDPDRFLPGGSIFDTIDEESSGVIPAPFLGEGKYLLDVQNHLASSVPGLVEKGQLLVMRVPAGQPVR